MDAGIHKEDPNIFIQNLPLASNLSERSNLNFLQHSPMLKSSGYKSRNFNFRVFRQIHL